jgi:hypothetical protein
MLRQATLRLLERDGLVERRTQPDGTALLIDMAEGRNPYVEAWFGRGLLQ